MLTGPHYQWQLPYKSRAKIHVVIHTQKEKLQIANLWAPTSANKFIIGHFLEQTVIKLACGGIVGRTIKKKEKSFMWEGRENDLSNIEIKNTHKINMAQKRPI